VRYALGALLCPLVVTNIYNDPVYDTVPSNKFGIRGGCDFVMKLVTCNI
jgi:hypothetical protein